MKTLLCFGLLILGGCNWFGGPDGSSSNPASFPDIGSFASSPSEQFFLDAAGLAKVSRGHPYMGSGETCAHTGAHVHFTNTGAPYQLNIYAPVDGTIARIDPCFNLGNGTDKYHITLDFASSGGEVLRFNFSIEPFDGELCTTTPGCSHDT